ncbi:MAG: hypothetical protein EZS28_000589 [Streblomastix strix]|uniref:Uncharacterized protein n=1 Tax=Streblomastix strix TaxID=222440 RepID=A0A5J4XAF2_9EUKA|nr:MAG: hypothetical protein EZS28_000589 [Streblomastix strix]
MYVSYDALPSLAQSQNNILQQQQQQQQQQNIANNNTINQTPQQQFIIVDSNGQQRISPFPTAPSGTSIQQASYPAIYSYPTNQPIASFPAIPQFTGISPLTATQFQAYPQIAAFPAIPSGVTSQQTSAVTTQGQQTSSQSSATNVQPSNQQQQFQQSQQQQYFMLYPVPFPGPIPGQVPLQGQIAANTSINQQSPQIGSVSDPSAKITKEGEDQQQSLNQSLAQQQIPIQGIPINLSQQLQTVYPAQVGGIQGSATTPILIPAPFGFPGFAQTQPQYFFSGYNTAQFQPQQ